MKGAGLENTLRKETESGGKPSREDRDRPKGGRADRAVRSGLSAWFMKQTIPIFEFDCVIACLLNPAAFKPCSSRRWRRPRRSRSAPSKLCFRPVGGPEGRLLEAMRYAALGGGKRLRGFLVQQSGRLFGVDRRALERVAAAVECVHATHSYTTIFLRWTTTI